MAGDKVLFTYLIFFDTYGETDLVHQPIIKCIYVSYYMIRISLSLIPDTHEQV